LGASGSYTLTIGDSAAITVPNSFTNVGFDIPLSGSAAGPTLNVNYTSAVPFQVNGSMNIGNATVNWNTPNAVLSISSALGMQSTGFGTQGVLNVTGGRINFVTAVLAGNPGTRSTVNVSNTGVIAFTSSNTRFGNNGTAQINLYDGGTMVWSNQAFLGYSVGSTGRMVIAGGTLNLAGGNFEIDVGAGGIQSSSDGYGQIILSNGLISASGFIIVAGGPRGRGDLSMYGGTVTNYGRPLVVGNAASATGTVLVAGGQWNQASGWSVGAGSNSLAQVTVTNTTVRFKFTNGHLLLGSGAYGTGNLDMTGGSMFFSDDATGGGFDNGMIIGLGANSSGRFYMSGGRLNMFGFGPGIVVGSNASAQASMILEGGRVEIQRLTVANAGVVSNRTGGLLQFLGGDTVTGPASQLIVDGGTLSYKGYSGLNVTGSVSKFSIVSGSGLQLETSTNLNIAGTYALTDAPGSFKDLSLAGPGSRWLSDSLFVDSSATLRATNAISARFASTVTNQGTIRADFSTVTWEKPVVNSGRYISDPSTNTFLSNMTVTASGTLEGGVGDVFDFKKNLFINSTNKNQFDVSMSIVKFSGGGNHTNAVTGGDFGTNGFPVADFMYGRLSLASTTDQVFFASGGFSNGSASNALYLRELELPGNNTNFVANLHSSFNIYYLLSSEDPFNTYLNDQTYSLSGGGLLTPFIPEPSSLTLLAVTAFGLALVRRKQNC
jgi:hypothetical protein